MKYCHIGCDYDPEITGKKDGAFSVEKKKTSFNSHQQEYSFNKFFIDNYKNEDRILLGGFQLFSCDEDFTITYYPRSKTVKPLDFMAYGPNEEGIQFLVSEKLYKILSEFKLPVHNRIPAKIDTFSQGYWLLGFATVPSSEIDFNKSIYYNHRLCRTEKFKNHKDHENADYDRLMSDIQILYFTTTFDYDIIHSTEGTFASSDVLIRLENENITGYKIKEGILTN